MFLNKKKAIEFLEHGRDPSSRDDQTNWIYRIKRVLECRNVVSNKANILCEDFAFFFAGICVLMK